MVNRGRQVKQKGTSQSEIIADTVLMAHQDREDRLRPIKRDEPREFNKKGAARDTSENESLMSPIRRGG